MSHKEYRVFITVLCIVVGIIHGSSYIISPILYPSPEGTTDLIFLMGSDEEHYIVQIKTAYEGKYHPGNRYLYEGAVTGDEEKRFSVDAINLNGLLGRISGFSFPFFIRSGRFILPMIAYLILYFIFCAISEGKRLLSAVFSFTTMLIPYAVYGHLHFTDRLLFEYLTRVKPGWNELLLNTYLPMSRLVNPQFSGLFFLAALCLLILFMLRPRGQIYLCISIPILGLLYELYFYFWTSLYVYIGIIFLGSLMLNIRRVRLPFLVVILIGGIAAFLQAPRLFTMAVDSYGSLYTYSNVQAMVMSPSLLGSAVILGMYLLFRIRFKPEERVVFFASILTPIICINQQIITGRMVQSWHYSVYVSYIYLWIALCLILNRAEVARRISEKSSWVLRRSGAIYKVMLILSGILLVGGLVGYYLWHASWSGHFTTRTLGSLLFYAGLWFMLTGGITCSAILLSGRHQRKWIPFITIIILLLSAGDGLERQITTILRQGPKHLSHQSYSGAVEWLRSNSAPSSVVMAPLEIAEILPAYTHNYVYISKNAVHYKVSDEERLERLAGYLFIRGYTRDEVSSLVRSYPYRYILWGLRYFSRERFDLYSFGKHNLISDREYQTFIGVYDRIARGKELPRFKYRLDYLLINTEDGHPAIIPATIQKDLKELYKDSSTTIYKYNTQ